MILVFVSPEQKQRKGGVEALEKALLAKYHQLRKTALGKESTATYADETASCFAYRFDLAKAKRLLDEPIGFWLGFRSAKPTTHEKKCQKCEFNAAGLCGSALARPDPDLVKSI